MIRFSGTSQSIQLITSSTSAVTAFISWVNHTASDSSFASGQANITTTTTTTLATGVASTDSQVKHISILNTGAGTQNITVQLNTGTAFPLHKVTPGAGEKIEYNDWEGWVVLNNTGAIKQTISQGNAPISTWYSMSVLASDVINNNATANTIQDVTGLSFPVTAGGKYYFKFVIPYTAAATTTGSRWSIQWPANTFLQYLSEYAIATTTTTRNPNNTAFDLPAASNAGSAGTTTWNVAYIEGYIQPSASGTVIARFASEIASSAITAKAGAFVEWIQV